jgi:hypothetical protein
MFASTPYLTQFSTELFQAQSNLFSIFTAVPPLHFSMVSGFVPSVSVSVRAGAATATSSVASSSSAFTAAPVRRASAPSVATTATRTIVTSQAAATKSTKKSINDLTSADLSGKVVLVRCDLNVPLDGKTITDETRIRGSIPTIEYLCKAGAKVVLASHLGRPKDGPEDKFSLAPVATRLSELLGKDVAMAPDCIGEDVAALIGKMSNGDVTLLENVRFYKEEVRLIARHLKYVIPSSMKQSFIVCI